MCADWPRLAQSCCGAASPTICNNGSDCVGSEMFQLAVERSKKRTIQLGSWIGNGDPTTPTKSPKSPGAHKKSFRGGFFTASSPNMGHPAAVRALSAKTKACRTEELFSRKQ